MIQQRWAGVTLAMIAMLVGVSASGAVLEDIDFASGPGDRMEIFLRFDSAPPPATVRTLDRPARIVLVVPGGRSGLDDQQHGLGTGNARSVSVIAGDDRMQVIVSLDHQVPTALRMLDTTLVVVLGGAGTPPAAGATDGRIVASGRADERARAAVAGRSTGAALVPTPATGVTDGRIVASGQADERARAAVVERSTGAALVPASATETTDGRVIAGGQADERGRVAVAERSTGGALVPASATEATDGRVIAGGQDDEWGRVAVAERPVRAALVPTAVAGAALAPVPAAAGDSAGDRFRGDKLSLNFQDIEVRAVLQLIADFTDMNLVASDSVQGRITLRLQQVPWDQALDLILKSRGLDQRQQDNVLLVAPAEEIAAREKLELESRQQLAALAPLRTEHIRVRYANAAHLLTLFRGATGESGGGAGRILSSRGSAIVDERTNAIIITDTAASLAAFRRVLAAIDVPIRQVLIEARIVSANTNFADALGVRWGGAGIRSSGTNGGGWVVAGGLEALPRAGGAGNPVAAAFPEALAVDLGVADSGSSTLGLGFLRRDFLIDLELSALVSEGQAEVVARPKIITGDKQAASIESGVEIPFQEASSSGATSTSFKDATLSLEVTPQITPDDRIIMDLAISQDSVGQIFQGVPSINTNAMTTQVLVDNGQTIVLGGIFQTSTSREVTKTPVLGDLPYLGRLFRRTVTRDDRQELLVFITPRIVDDPSAETTLSRSPGGRSALGGSHASAHGNTHNRPGGSKPGQQTRGVGAGTRAAVPRGDRAGNP